MIIEDQHHDVFKAFLKSLFPHHPDAVSLCMMLIKVSHVWDDLIDRDNDSLSNEDVNYAFRCLMYDIPINPIYRAIPSLPDHLLNIYLKWSDATKMESEDDPGDDDLNKCYMLRAGIYDVISLIAYHLGGADMYQQVGPAIRRLYGEKLNDYKEEIRNA